MADEPRGPRGEQLPTSGERPVFGKHSLSYADRDSAPALQGSTSRLPKRQLPEYAELQRAWREAHRAADEPPDDTDA